MKKRGSNYSVLICSNIVRSSETSTTLLFFFNTVIILDPVIITSCGELLKLKMASSALETVFIYPKNKR